MNDTTMKSLDDNPPKSSTMPSFWAYMQPDHISDSLDGMVDALSDHGLKIAIPPEDMFDWGDDEDALFNVRELSLQMWWWGGWLEAKAKGYEALRDLGTAGIKKTAEILETVAKEVEGINVSGEWCRLDGVIYVFCGDTFDTSVAHSRGRKPSRDREDRATALWMLKNLHEHAKMQKAA